MASCYAAPTELKSLFCPNPINRSRLRRFQSRSPTFSTELLQVCVPIFERDRPHNVPNLPLTKINLTINGAKQVVEVDDDTPLLWILRDTLGLTGTKYGCGVGVCGACTVLENGAAVRSCQVPGAEIAERSFTTIEGLSTDGNHPCQKAWLEEEVAQCGFCQPGMIMTACALLKKHAQPSDADIDEMMSDSVCRCGTYPRMRKAIHRASAAMAKAK